MANTKCWQCLILLNKILSKVESIDRNLYDQQPSRTKSDLLDFTSLLSLPDHTRDSLLVLMRNNYPMTAYDISSITKRSRTTECSNLNQLKILGLISSERRGRQVFFSLKNQTVLKAQKLIEAKQNE